MLFRSDVVTGEYHYIGDKSVQVEQWDKIPAVMGVREFYGGDLQGIMNKLDYLQAVSYTHLDVYKRQVLLICQRIQITGMNPYLKGCSGER